MLFELKLADMPNASYRWQQVAIMLLQDRAEILKGELPVEVAPKFPPMNDFTVEYEWQTRTFTLKWPFVPGNFLVVQATEDNVNAVPGTDVSSQKKYHTYLLLVLRHIFEQALLRDMGLTSYTASRL
jgi:hypothetical protein